MGLERPGVWSSPARLQLCWTVGGSWDKAGTGPARVRCEGRRDSGRLLAAAPAGGPGVLLSPGPAVGQSYVCSGGERAGTSQNLPASLSVPNGRLGEPEALFLSGHLW